MSRRTLGRIDHRRSAEFVSTAAITVATTLVVTGLQAGYDYIIQLEAFGPTDDAEALWMRLSDDGGSTYEAGASDYAWGITVASVFTQDDADAQIDLTNGLGSDTGSRSTLAITLVNANSIEETTAYWDGYVMSTASPQLLRDVRGGALFEQGAGVVDAVQFLWSGGSTFKATGNITVWRRKRS